MYTKWSKVNFTRCAQFEWSLTSKNWDPLIRFLLHFEPSPVWTELTHLQEHSEGIVQRFFASLSGTWCIRKLEHSVFGKDFTIKVMTAQCPVLLSSRRACLEMHWVAMSAASITPTMATIRITTHKEQRHSFLSTSSRLEENSFSVLAIGTTHILGTRQSGIWCNILQHLRALIGAVKHLVPVHTIVVRHLLMIAISAGVEQNLLIPILSRIQNIVTLSAKFHGTHGDGFGDSLRSSQFGCAQSIYVAEFSGEELQCCSDGTCLDRKSVV